MQATFYHADDPQDLNSGYYRVTAPAAALRAAGHDIVVDSALSFRHAEGNGKDIDLIDYALVRPTVLLERNATVERIRMLRLAGAQRIVLTFDDHYGALKPGSNAYDYWHATGHFKDFLRCLEQVDAVTVPSRWLADKYQAHARSIIQVIPNYLDPTLWEKARKPGSTDGKVRIGWGGTKQHAASWANSRLPEALYALQVQYGAQLELIFWNQVADPFLRKAGVSFQSRPLQRFEDWPKALSELDILVAPLAGEYDAARSNLKVLEAAMLGIPWVATAMPPYAESYGGYCIPSQWNKASPSLELEAWRNTLYNLISDPAERQHLAAQGLRWSEQYRLENCVAPYQELLWP